MPIFLPFQICILYYYYHHGQEMRPAAEGKQKDVSTVYPATNCTHMDRQVLIFSYILGRSREEQDLIFSSSMREKEARGVENKCQLHLC